MSKLEGSLGFRDFHQFNLVLLARQGWRLVKYPNSFCACILKGIYFPHSNFMEGIYFPHSNLGLGRVFYKARIFYGKAFVGKSIVGPRQNSGRTDGCHLFRGLR